MYTLVQVARRTAFLRTQPLTPKPSLSLTSAARMVVSIFARGETAKCAGSRPELIIARHVVYAAWDLIIIVHG